MSIRIAAAAFTLSLSAALVSVACAQDAVIARGRQIAAQKCAICHATGATGESPHRSSPPLRELHEWFPIEMLESAMKTGVISGHDEMPMFEFSASDIHALLSYLDSLSPIGRRYLQQSARP